MGGIFLLVGSGLVRVMPLGDSITQGSPLATAGSYRLPLYGLLTASNVYVDFVGELSDGAFAEPEHEGLTGYEIGGIWGQVDQAHILQTFFPSIILLLIGTNDIWHGSFSMDPGDALVTYGHLLDSIAVERPSVKTICGSIPPIASFVAGSTVSSNVDVFNAGLPALIASKGSKFSFVDINAGLTTADLVDGVHPSTGGNDKIAALWKPAILAVM